MTSELHNLDDGVSEHFEFILGGFKYKMRYPTSEELATIAKYRSKEKAGEKTFEFISPVDDKAPPISELVQQIPVNKFRKFMEMVRQEVGY